MWSQLQPAFEIDLSQSKNKSVLPFSISLNSLLPNERTPSQVCEWPGYILQIQHDKISSDVTRHQYQETFVSRNCTRIRNTCYGTLLLFPFKLISVANGWKCNSWITAESMQRRMSTLYRYPQQTHSPPSKRASCHFFLVSIKAKASLKSGIFECMQSNIYNVNRTSEPS